ncbi:alpha/beta hydrolase [Streptosporangiaceae bacterium NEAU-GS5]|nr:alpha/beta hydrolase [Streptosporangiaceae bacterium NEAU-GS5]
MSARPAYDTGHVVSTDGTRIGYRRMGDGPGLLILHGGALGSQHYLKLAALLADEFTVYLPDRRGRRLSGPYGDHYSIRTEDEDLAALVAATGARYAFGPADGGLFALHASMSVPELERVAVYEPVLFVGQPGTDEFVRVIERFNERVDRGDVVGAAVGLTKDSEASKLVSAVPDAVLRPLFRLALWADAWWVKGDYTPLRDLIPTLRPELAEVRATEGTLDDYRKVSARVLLIRGGKAQPLFTGTLDALHRVLPVSDLVVIPGLHHGSAQDQGNPQAIADVIKPFFTAP